MHDEMDFDSFLAQGMWGLTLDDVCEACSANINGSEYINHLNKKLKKENLQGGRSSD